MNTSTPIVRAVKGSEKLSKKRVDGGWKVIVRDSSGYPAIGLDCRP